MPGFIVIAWETLLRDFCNRSSNSKQDDDETEEKKKSIQSLSRLEEYGTCHEGFSRRTDGLEIQAEESNSSGGEVDGTIPAVDSSLPPRPRLELVDDNPLCDEIEGDRVESLVLDDEFFDSHRSTSSSVASSTELNDDFGRRADSKAAVSSGSEFIDVDEDGSSSDVSSCHCWHIESELSTIRLSLHEEIERRKSIEDALGQMYSQWQRVGNLLHEAGLTFPILSNASSMQDLDDSVEQLCQELHVARFVAEAIGRGQARAEAELAADLIYKFKDQEISRLQGRLQYYEVVCHEMSLRNQKNMVITRRRQQMKRNLQKCFWGCVGLSIAVGASVLTSASSRIQVSLIRCWRQNA